MLFSQREGFTPVKDIIQYESMDQDLRNAIANVFYDFFYSDDDPFHIELDKDFRNVYWAEYLKEKKSELATLHRSEVLSRLDTTFIEDKWHQIYDLVELTSIKFNHSLHHEQELTFNYKINEVLEKENSAYRFVDTVLLKIFSNEEIKCIESAIQKNDKNSGIKIHLEQALKHLSDRKNPDYRNSIKESISAVESLCKFITGKKNATLGDALKRINNDREILPNQLKPALTKLYGYTNDGENGIRHALIDGDVNVNYSEAQFMLICCSAFINYINTKKSEN